MTEQFLISQQHISYWNVLVYMKLVTVLYTFVASQYDNDNRQKQL